MFSKGVSLETFPKAGTLGYKRSKKPTVQRTGEGAASTKVLKWEYCFEGQAQKEVQCDQSMKSKGRRYKDHWNDW